MKSPLHAILGSAIGVALAMLLIGRITPHSSLPQTGPMLSDCGGPIRSLVLQYTSGATFAAPIYHQFLTTLDPSVDVTLACPDQPAWDELRSSLGPLANRLHPVFTHHPMTAWSRDRWVPLAPITPDAPTTLYFPQGEDGAENWPDRAGDNRIASDLALAFHPRIDCRRSALFFDGGDLLADGPFLFIAGHILPRNLHRTVNTPEDLLNILQQETALQPILLTNAPDHHLGMYMMSLGHHRMLVADPSLAQPLLPTIAPDLLARLPGGPDFSPATQQQFDYIATALAAKGYAITRIPAIPAAGSRAYLTYTNVILDHRNHQDIVFLPEFRGADTMNAAAEKIWHNAGFIIHPIDCTATFSLGGTLHCLVNISGREPNP